MPDRSEKYIQNQVSDQSIEGHWVQDQECYHQPTKSENFQWVQNKKAKRIRRFVATVKSIEETIKKG